MKQFELKQEHLNLLRKANISWSDGEYGAPGIDTKRPYGNSGMGADEDIAKAIGIKGHENRDGEIFFDSEQEVLIEKFHVETEYALQIVLKFGEFKTGKFIYNDHYEWEEA